MFGFDKTTGERIASTLCPANNALFYKTKYEIDGYRAEILTDEQVDEYLSNGGK